MKLKSNKHRSTLAINLKKLRNSKGVSQKEAGDILGVTYQQYQKYENGSNRISAEYLYILARELGFKMERFFTED